MAEPGQVVSAGQVVVRLAQTGAREALVVLPETIRPLIGSAAQATECGTKEPITVAEMTWLSAGTLAYVTKTILGEGYGCNVQIVPGDTVPTATSMLTITGVIILLSPVLVRTWREFNRR